MGDSSYIAIDRCLPHQEKSHHARSAAQFLSRDANDKRWIMGLRSFGASSVYNRVRLEGLDDELDHGPLCHLVPHFNRFYKELRVEGQK